MKVVCLNTGTAYRRDGYTAKLYNSLRRNSNREWSFECIMESKFPGWWGKMEIYPAKERTIYLDLDTVICGNIDFLFDYEGEFCIRQNPWPRSGWCDASVISLAAGAGHAIHDAFFANPAKAMRDFRSDQEFTASIIPHADTWQEFAPGKTASYKADYLQEGPGDAVLVAMHGFPKPHDLPKGHWVLEHWR